MKPFALTILSFLVFAIFIFASSVGFTGDYDSLSASRIRPVGSVELPEGYFNGPGVGLESLFGLARPPNMGSGKIVMGGAAKSITVAVFKTQLLDPGPGGYWILLSANRGEKWAPPLYTGMAVGEPVIIKGAVHFPIVEAGAIKLEGLIDAKSSPDGKAHDNLLLSMPLALLNKDSDGDGLTDLMEERLLTNPASIDSDGDGLADRKDGAPLVARPPTGAEDKVRDDAMRIIVRNEKGRWAQAAREGGIVIVKMGGNRNPHSFTHNPARIIWLSKDDIGRYDSKFGPRDVFSFVSIKISGDSATVYWSFASQRNKLRLRRTGGQWVAR